MHIHSKSFFWAAVCAACLCFFLWLNSIKYVEAKRDINVVNRAHLRAITLLLDLYRENHSGNLPKSLDDLKPLIDDYRVLFGEIHSKIRGCHGSIFPHILMEF